MVCALAWLAAGPLRSPLTINVCIAVVAASTAYVIDDPAAATLATSPTTLRRRRAHRVLAAVVGVAAWWAVAVAVIALRAVETAVAADTLRLAAFVTIALATSAWVDRVGHDNAGTAGAVAVLAAFGSSYLPERWLQVVPADPVDGAARRHLLLTAIVALGLVPTASADPAHRQWWGRRPPDAPKAHRPPRSGWTMRLDRGDEDQPKSSTES
jgi:hypothetical protein